MVCVLLHALRAGKDLRAGHKNAVIARKIDGNIDPRIGHRTGGGERAVKLRCFDLDRFGQTVVICEAEGDQLHAAVCAGACDGDGRAAQRQHGVGRENARDNGSVSAQKISSFDAESMKLLPSAYA